MTHVLFVGQKPDTVDFSDPFLPPGFDAEKIQAGIDIAETTMTGRGWEADICMIPPDDSGIATLAARLAKVDFDCVVVGGGLRIPIQRVAVLREGRQRDPPKCAEGGNRIQHPSRGYGGGRRAVDRRSPSLT